MCEKKKEKIKAYFIGLVMWNKRKQILHWPTDAKLEIMKECIKKNFFFIICLGWTNYSKGLISFVEINIMISIEMFYIYLYNM
jgi:hypothetical protein